MNNDLKDTNIELSVLAPFKKWMTSPKRHKISFGGRGGGKTESIVRLLLVLSYKHNGATILCVREVQNTLSESSKATIEALIRELDIAHHFDIKKDHILNRITGTQFIFKGLRSCTAENLQSIANVCVCFIEEAQVISDYSWLVLEPSIRAKNSEVWVAFNPRHEGDCFYKMVSQFELTEKSYKYENQEYPFKEYEDKNRLILNINYNGNAYHTKDSVLEISRQMLLESNPLDYNHVWLGQLKKSQGRIFNQNNFKFYNYQNYKENLECHYVKHAIVDPAFGIENCYTSCIIYSQVGHDYYIIDSGLMRNNENTTTDELIVDFLKSYEVKTVMIESNFNQKELVRRIKRLNLFDVIPFTVHKNKIERIVNAQYDIRDKVFFDEESTKLPSIKSTQTMLETRAGRNYIALRQLLDFSDNNKENCIKGDDFSFIDFPDALASLMMYGKKRKSNDKIEVVGFGVDGVNTKSSHNNLDKRKNNMGFGING